VTKVQNSEMTATGSDRDSLDITASQLRMLVCSQLVIVRVERGDIRLWLETVSVELIDDETSIVP